MKSFLMLINSREFQRLSSPDAACANLVEVLARRDFDPAMVMQ